MPAVVVVEAMVAASWGMVVVTVEVAMAIVKGARLMLQSVLAYDSLAAG